MKVMPKVYGNFFGGKAECHFLVICFMRSEHSESLPVPLSFSSARRRSATFRVNLRLL
jgi:hypothetical protein